jgi:hypothetical protein
LFFVFEEIVEFIKAGNAQNSVLGIINYLFLNGCDSCLVEEVVQKLYPVEMIVGFVLNSPQRELLKTLESINILFLM